MSAKKNDKNDENFEINLDDELNLENLDELKIDSDIEDLNLEEIDISKTEDSDKENETDGNVDLSEDLKLDSGLEDLNLDDFDLSKKDVTDKENETDGNVDLSEDLKLDELNLDDINYDIGSDINDKSELTDIKIDTNDYNEKVDLSEDLNLDEFNLDNTKDINSDDSEINELESLESVEDDGIASSENIENEINENIEPEKNIDINLDDLDLSMNELNIEDDKNLDITDELENVSISSDVGDFNDDTLTDQNLTPQEDIGNIDLNLDNLDLESDLLDLEKDTLTNDVKRTKSPKVVDSKEDELDLKSDLGLEDELSLSGDASLSSGNDYDIDLVDDQGSHIESSVEEYGVALKSDPETIDTTLDDSDINVDEIIDNEQYIEEMDKDNNIEKISFPEKKEITIDDDQDDFLSKEINDNNLNDEIELLKSMEPDKEGIGNISFDEDLAFDNKSKDEIGLVDNLDEEISNLDLDIGLEEEKEKSKDSDDDEDTLLMEEINFDEAAEDSKSVKGDDLDNLSLEDFNIDEKDIKAQKEDFSDTDTELDFNILDDGNELSENNVESTDTDLEELSLDDMSIGEEVLEISDENIEKDSINLENSSEIKDNNDIMNFNETPSVIQSTILKENNSDMNDFEDNKINIEEGELSEIEDKLFPDDVDLPELDDDIKNIAISSDEEELSNSISPLTDAHTVFSDSPEIDLTMYDDKNETEKDAIDLENIPEPLQMNDDENESIGLSNNELDEIISSSDLIEEKQDDDSETIDLDTLDAELKEVEDYTENLDEDEKLIKDIRKYSENLITDEEIEYANLKSQMGKTKDENVSSDINVLKKNVKEVLSYLDQLLDALPEEKIKEFAKSSTFNKYKKLFEELKIL